MLGKVEGWLHLYGDLKAKYALNKTKGEGSREQGKAFQTEDSFCTQD